MTSKEKIRDIKSVINEFYHNEKCEGKLTECARKSWLVFQEYCDDILQDIERLEVLEQENEHLKEMLSIANYVGCGAEEKVWDLTQENEKLKKAIEILKGKLEVFETINSKVFNTQEYCILCNRKLTQQEYELLKEVINNE